jgi:hypothetical protein
MPSSSRVVDPARGEPVAYASASICFGGFSCPGCRVPLLVQKEWIFRLAYVLRRLRGEDWRVGFKNTERLCPGGKEGWRAFYVFFPRGVGCKREAIDEVVPDNKDWIARYSHLRTFVLVSGLNEACEAGTIGSAGSCVLVGDVRATNHCEPVPSSVLQWRHVIGRECGCETWGLERPAVTNNFGPDRLVPHITHAIGCRPWYLEGSSKNFSVHRQSAS